MKVLLFLNDFLPYSSGAGGFVMTWALTRILLESGHEPIVCCFGGGGEGSVPWFKEARRHMSEFGVAVHSLHAPKPANFSRLFRFRRAVFPRCEDFYPQKCSVGPLRSIIDKTQPDVLYLFTMKAVALLASFTGGPPRVASIIDLDPELCAARRQFQPSTGRLGRLYDVLDKFGERKLERWMVSMLHHCDLVFEHAAHHARHLHERGVKCLYIPNPVEDPYAAGPSSASKKASSQDSFRISLIGSLHGISTVAGLKYLLKEILPVMPADLREKVEIHIIGQGRGPAEFRDAIRRHPHVFFRGYVENISREFETTDALFVPTPIALGFRTRIAHGFGFGAPVVAHLANAAGMPELKHQENCWLCNKADEFWVAVRRLREDQVFGRKLSANARKTFESCYSSRVVCQQMIAQMVGLTRQTCIRRELVANLYS